MTRGKRGGGKPWGGRGSRGSKYLAAPTASGSAGDNDALSANVPAQSPAENQTAQGVSTPSGYTSQSTATADTSQEVVDQVRHLLYFPLVLVCGAADVL